MVLPGGFGTLGELTEVMRLIQTGKTRRTPVILVGTPFWRGLLDWMREQMVSAGMIDARHLELLQLIDKPANVVEAIFAYYEARDIVRDKTEQSHHSFL